MTSTGAAEWLIVSAAAAGTSHLRSGRECDDRHAARMFPMSPGETAFVAVVADGAGSAPLSGVGAEVASREFAFRAATHFEDPDPFPMSVDLARSWLWAARDAVAATAHRNGAPLGDFACTFLAAVVGEREAVVLQVGDGVIAYRDDGGAWRHAFWPQTGEHHNETFFLTDSDLDGRLMVRHLRERLRSVALTSDGLEDLCLDRERRRLFVPYFDTLFAPLEQAGANDEGHLSDALDRYLQSDAVNARTDDDKTLVLAHRRAPQRPGG